jgi:hypothetical protein
MLYPGPHLVLLNRELDPWDDDLNDAYYAFRQVSPWGYATLADFIAAAARFLGWDLSQCYCCGDLAPSDHDDWYSGIDGERYCGLCYSDTFTSCDECGDEIWRDDSHYADWCELVMCASCYHDAESERNGCTCEAPNMRFRFPANGAGTVCQDERLDVTLPSGTISDEGLAEIRYLVTRDLECPLGIDHIWGDLGDQWQGKRGNYTRRLSSALHKAGGYKLSAEALSKVGNIARQHSSDGSEWAIEFTRDLNLPAEDFYHEDSCWWQSYSKSRCALKNWGGIGMRTFGEWGGVEGRAWVQPLDADMRPTHDAANAHAYVVYNGYGDLSGYAAARIVAHLTGRTYRKVGFSADPQYVNAGGYLIADAATCEEYGTVTLPGNDAHYTYDAAAVGSIVAA